MFENVNSLTAENTVTEDERTALAEVCFGQHN